MIHTVLATSCAIIRVRSAPRSDTKNLVAKEVRQHSTCVGEQTVLRETMLPFFGQTVVCFEAARCGSFVDEMKRIVLAGSGGHKTKCMWTCVSNVSSKVFAMGKLLSMTYEGGELPHHVVVRDTSKAVNPCPPLRAHLNPTWKRGNTLDTIHVRLGKTGKTLSQITEF